MHLLGWALVLLLIGLALIMLEVFVPSGGIIGFMAALTILAAIGLGFYASPLLGVGLTFASIVAVPALISLALRIWPSTPMGRRILLAAPTENEVLPDNELLRELKQLVGRTGVAKTVMLPSGAILVDGRTIDAVAQGMAIDPGQKIRVVEVRGMRVMVRPLLEGEAADAPSPAKSANPLDQPIEALGIEDFEDPLLGN